MSSNALSTKTLTKAGLLSAITIILVFTPIGMIMAPWISFTICHIPTIIAAVLFGPTFGMAIGLVFGISTLLRGLVAPLSVLDPFFINPAVSILPRVLIGITAGYSAKLLKNVNDNISIVVGAGIGSLTNTFGCLTVLYFIYAKDIVEKLQMPAESFIWAVITTSGITEMAVAILLTFPIIKVMKKIV